MKHFSKAALETIHATKYFYLRAGDEHRFTPVWVVVVDGRVLVRPWNDKASGWYREFLKKRQGAIKLDGKEIAVRARRATGKRLNDAIDAGYAAKYTTKANQKYVKGFATAKRRATSLELTP